MRNSLKRIILIVGSWKIALILLLVSVLIKFSINYYEDKLFKVKNNQFSEVLKEKVTKLIEFNNTAILNAQKLYQEIDIDSFIDGKFQKSELFSNIIFFSKENKLIHSIKKPVLYNFESSKRALKTLSYTISPAYLNELENKSYYDISFPYFKDNELKGVVSFSVGLNDIFNELTANFNFKKTGQLYIVQKNFNNTFSYIGSMVDDLLDIAPLYFKEISANISEAQIDAIEGRANSFVYTNYKGIESLAVITYVPELQYGVVIYAPFGLNALTSFIKNYVFYITGILFVIAIVITCIKSSDNRKIFFYILDRGVILFLLFLIAFLIISYKTQDKRQEEISFINLKEQASYFNQKINKTIESLKLTNQFFNNYIVSNFLELNSNPLDAINSDELLQNLISESFEINPILSNILIGTQLKDKSFKVQMLARDFPKSHKVEDIQWDMLQSNLDYSINNKIDSEADIQMALTPFYFAQFNNYYSGFLNVETIEDQKIIIMYLVNIDEFKKNLPDFNEIYNGSAYIATSSELLFSTLTTIHDNTPDNLYSISEATKNKSYFSALNKMRANKTGFELIASDSNQADFWIFYSPVEKINSYLLIFVSSNDVKISQKEKNNYYNYIFLATVLILCLILSDLINLKLYNKKKLKRTSFILTSIFVIATIIFINFGQIKSNYFNITNKLINNKSIEYYMLERENESSELNIPPPSFLPISIFIEEFYFTNDNDTFLSGYAFINYSQKILDLDIKRGFYFPDGNEAIIDLVESKKNDNGITEIYKFNVKFASLPDLKKYPFDVFKINFVIQPLEILNNIIFIPNLDLYKNPDPENLPGLDLTIESENFRFVRSYFQFEKTGFQINTKSNEAFTFFNISFNIDYVKNTMTVFVVYLLPLLVIVVSTFAVLWMVVYGEFDSMQTSLAATGAYTALTFALIIMHTALRSKYEAPSVIYLEALFFPTYTIIMLLLIHSMFLNYKARTVSRIYSDKILHLNELFIYIFWPLQTGLWFLISYYSFY